MTNTQPETKRGVTLIETVVLVAIMGIMAVVGTSAILSYHRTSVMEAELRIVMAHMQRARQLAVGNANGSPYSVAFFASRYEVFEGQVWASHPDNLVHELDTNVLVSTTYTNDTVTFDSFTGRTGAAGSIELSAFGMNRTISINALGIVDDIS